MISWSLLLLVSYPLLGVSATEKVNPSTETKVSKNFGTEMYELLFDAPGRFSKNNRAPCCKTHLRTNEGLFNVSGPGTSSSNYLEFCGYDYSALTWECSTRLPFIFDTIEEMYAIDPHEVLVAIYQKELLSAVEQFECADQVLNDLKTLKQDVPKDCLALFMDFQRVLMGLSTVPNTTPTEMNEDTDRTPEFIKFYQILNYLLIKTYAENATQRQKVYKRIQEEFIRRIKENIDSRVDQLQKYRISKDDCSKAVKTTLIEFYNQLCEIKSSNGIKARELNSKVRAVLDEALFDRFKETLDPRNLKILYIWHSFDQKHLDSNHPKPNKNEGGSNNVIKEAENPCETEHSVKINELIEKFIPKLEICLNPKIPSKIQANISKLRERMSGLLKPFIGGPQIDISNSKDAHLQHLGQEVTKIILEKLDLNIFTQGLEGYLRQAESTPFTIMNFYLNMGKIRSLFEKLKDEYIKKHFADISEGVTVCGMKSGPGDNSSDGKTNYFLKEKTEDIGDSSHPTTIEPLVHKHLVNERLQLKSKKAYDPRTWDPDRSICYSYTACDVIVKLRQRIIEEVMRETRTGNNKP